jgi:hypothetical protein
MFTNDYELTLFQRILLIWVFIACGLVLALQAAQQHVERPWARWKLTAETKFVFLDLPPFPPSFLSPLECTETDRRKQTILVHLLRPRSLLAGAGLPPRADGCHPRHAGRVRGDAAQRPVDRAAGGRVSHGRRGCGAGGAGGCQAEGEGQGAVRTDDVPKEGSECELGCLVGQ